MPDRGHKAGHDTGDDRLTARAISRELNIGQGDVIEGSQLERMSDEVFLDRIDIVFCVCEGDGRA